MVTESAPQTPAPLIDVLMRIGGPVRIEWIQTALNSLNAQTGADWHLFARIEPTQGVDASPPMVAAVLTTMVAPSRLTWAYGPDEGAGVAYNALASMIPASRGPAPIVALLDCDDRLATAEAMATICALAAANPDAGAFHSRALEVGPDGATIAEPKPFPPTIRLVDLLHSQPLHHMRAWRRSALATSGGWREMFTVAAHADLTLRLAVRYRVPFARTEAVLYEWRRHPEQVTARCRDQVVAYLQHARRDIKRWAVV